MHQSESIGLYINIASHQIRRMADSISARYGLTGIQSRILAYIAGMAERDIFQKDIERQFGIRRSSVTSVISNLEQNGFLTRRAVPSDARLKKLELTEKGAEVMEELSCSIRELEQTLDNYFTPQEREILLKMLKTIIQNLDCTPNCDCGPGSENNNQDRKDETLC